MDLDRRRFLASGGLTALGAGFGFAMAPIPGWRPESTPVSAASPLDGVEVPPGTEFASDWTMPFRNPATGMSEVTGILAHFDQPRHQLELAPPPNHDGPSNASFDASSDIKLWRDGPTTADQLVAGELTLVSGNAQRHGELLISYLGPVYYLATGTFQTIDAHRVRVGGEELVLVPGTDVGRLGSLSDAEGAVVTAFYRRGADGAKVAGRFDRAVVAA